MKYPIMEGKTTWIQCEKPSCGKWRTIKQEIADSYKDLPWTCSMNRNVLYRKCSAPEEEIAVGKGKRVVLTKLPYENGDVIMARVAGYCQWPALVCPDPVNDLYYDAVLNEDEVEDEITHIHVEFFGVPRTHAWVTPNKICEFCKERRFKATRNSNAIKQKQLFTLAMQQAVDALSYSCEERLKRRTFKTVDDLSKPSREKHIEDNWISSKTLASEQIKIPSKDVDNLEKMSFFKCFKDYLAQRGLPDIKGPVWNGVSLNLYEIFHIVQRNGGYVEVTKNRSWNILRKTLIETNGCVPSKSCGNLKIFYRRHLLNFEMEMKNLKNSIKGIADLESFESQHLPDECSQVSFTPSKRLCSELNMDESTNISSVGVSDLICPDDSSVTSTIPKKLCYDDGSSCDATELHNISNTGIDAVQTTEPISALYNSPEKADHESKPNVCCYLTPEIVNSANDFTCLIQRLPALHPNYVEHTPNIDASGERLLKSLQIEYVPSSNPSSPQFPLQEDLDVNCEIEIQKELEALENLLNKENKVADDIKNEEKRGNSPGKSFARDVTSAIKEIFELEDHILKLEETTRLDFI